MHAYRFSLHSEHLQSLPQALKFDLQSFRFSVSFEIPAVSFVTELSAPVKSAIKLY